MNTNILNYWVKYHILLIFNIYINMSLIYYSIKINILSILPIEL